MTRALTILLAALGLVGMCGGLVLLAAAARQGDHAFWLGLCAVALGWAGCLFLADHFEHIGRAAGRAEAETFRKGLRP